MEGISLAKKREGLLARQPFVVLLTFHNFTLAGDHARRAGFPDGQNVGDNG